MEGNCGLTLTVILFLSECFTVPCLAKRFIAKDGVPNKFPVIISPITDQAISVDNVVKLLLSNCHA